ncbi:hypothetical protein E1211_23860 [Micromonospora sp. 15K316]|uniref:hypothetical protein n=1 Tax=Micromonospora sp. 15K316 TaxID=2530376 RepID=UPI00105390F5|nr:hypothetical protein [Micromonospora sp. 15K316]TDC30627.1 hypothetical protein E1211_23860 [Micromonospora sp. 15K316]
MNHGTRILAAVSAATLFALITPSAAQAAAPGSDSASGAVVAPTTPRAAPTAAGGDIAPLGNCTAGIFCGEVKNRLGRSVKISGNWPSNTKTMMLPAGAGSGSDSSSYYEFRDTDGFQVPAGYYYTDTVGNKYYPGWHKVNDLQEVTLNGWCDLDFCD